MTSFVPKKKKLTALKIPTAQIFSAESCPTLELVQVSPSLYISSYESAKDVTSLKIRGITHILNLADLSQCPNVSGSDFHYMSMHLNDNPDFNMLNHLDLILRFIDNAIIGGGKILIHCNQGKSRSPTVACAYLIWKHTMPASVALATVREAQPLIDPNLGFVSQLETFSEIIKDREQEIIVQRFSLCAVTD